MALKKKILLKYSSSSRTELCFSSIKYRQRKHIMCVIVTLQLGTGVSVSLLPFACFDLVFLFLASSALCSFPFATSMRLYCCFCFFSCRERSNITSVTFISAKNKPTSVDVFHSSPQLYSQVQYMGHLVFHT